MAEKRALGYEVSLTVDERASVGGAAALQAVMYRLNQATRTACLLRQRGILKRSEPVICEQQTEVIEGETSERLIVRSDCPKRECGLGTEGSNRITCELVQLVDAVSNEAVAPATE